MNFTLLNRIPLDKFYSDPKYLFNTFEKFLNIQDNKNNKDNKYYKSIVLFLVIFICYILYTIKSQIVPGLLFAFVLASFFHLNRKKIISFTKKYNLNKLPYINNII